MKPNEDLPVNVEHSRLRELADRLGQLHSNDRQILWLKDREATTTRKPIHTLQIK